MEPSLRVARAVFDHDAVVTVTRDGIVCEWSGGAERLLGRAAATVVGVSLADLVVPEDAAAALAEIKRQARDVALTWIRGDGTRVPSVCSALPIPAEGGNAAATSVVVRHRRTSASALAHDISSPLAALTLDLELACADVEALTTATPSGERMREILEALESARSAAAKAREMCSTDATAEPHRADDTSPSPRTRILVVDDEASLVRALVRRLAREHEVAGLTDPREALELLRSGERYDVVICDLHMPHLTGMDLHAELSRSVPEMAQRMIFLCGGAFTERSERFLAEVSNHRLSKPIDIARLRDAVRALTC